MDISRYVNVGLIAALGMTQSAVAQDMPLRPVSDHAFPQYAEIISKQIGASLPACQGNWTEGLCLHAYSASDGSYAIVEVCKWVADSTKPYAIDRNEGIYLVALGRVARFPWFESHFNRWTCINRYPDEYEYRVHIGKSGAVSRIKLEYRVNQEAGTYELAPRGRMLRVLKHKSVDLT